MKKIFATVVSIAIMASAYAEWALTFNAGLFYHADGTIINEDLNFALIVDMNGKGFESFELTEGDTFERNTFINQKNDYKTLVTGHLEDPLGFGEWTAWSKEDWKFINEDYGFAGGEEVAIVVWGAESFTMIAEDFYSLTTPSIMEGQLGSEDKWVVPAGDAPMNIQWDFATTDYFGDVPPEYATLSNVVVSIVPEPSTYAAIFGALALGFVVIRRRK